MGQMTFGIMYGIPAPENDEELLEEWADENEGVIAANNYWGDRSKIVPEFEPENDIGSFIGFWIAAGASGKDDVPYLEAVCLEPLSHILSKYSDRIKEVEKRWKAFSNWVKKKKEIKLPKPKFYLLETEVA